MNESDNQTKIRTYTVGETWTIDDAEFVVVDKWRPMPGYEAVTIRERNETIRGAIYRAMMRRTLDHADGETDWFRS